MKSEDRLLNDVIRDADYEEFQREVRGRIVREVRRKKAVRAARVVLAMAAAVVLCASLWLRERPVNQSATEPPTARDRMTLRSSGAVEVVRSNGEIEVVRTRTEPVEVIADGELLAMFRDEVVALVGHKGERRLVMLGAREVFE